MHRNSKLARKKRRELVATLGNVCALLDSTCNGNLEIDHVYGRTWEPRTFSSLARVNRYLDEYKQGVQLQDLCKSHNTRKQRDLERSRLTFNDKPAF
jgi:hypothetical protein